MAIEKHKSTISYKYLLVSKFVLTLTMLVNIIVYSSAKTSEIQKKFDNCPQNIIDKFEKLLSSKDSLAYSIIIKEEE